VSLLRTGPAIVAPIFISSHPAGRQVTTHWNCSVGSRRLFWKGAHQTQAGWTREAAKNSKDFSRTFSGPSRRGARPIDQLGCSARGARARRHTSRVDDQSAAPGPSPTSADRPVRAGHRPVQSISGDMRSSFMAPCHITGRIAIGNIHGLNRSITGSSLGTQSD